MSLGNAESIGALHYRHFGEGIATTAIAGSSILSKTESIGTVVRIATYALIPIEILIIAS